MPQVPPLHVADPVPAVGPAQTFPQPAQLSGSELVLTHAPLQRVGVKNVHVRPQVPPLQVATPVPDEGAGHLFPHAPQLFGSVAVTVQVPLQLTWPVVHPAQAPFVHVWPAAQV